MQRVTISIDDDLLAAIDAIGAQRGYSTRSESLRDILREAVKQDGATQHDAPCFATLSYVFEHETRDLARRLTTEQHHHHAISISTLHVHVDEDDCLEVVVLKGTVSEVRAFADAVIAQRGVRYGHLHVIPARHGAPSRA